MYRVLIVGMTEMTGGVESVIMNYYRNFDKNKIKTDFLATDSQIAYQDEILANDDKIFNIIKKSKNLRQHKRDLINVFKKEKYDAIWVNLCTLSNIDYLRYAKKFGVKVRIIHSHNSQNMGGKLTKILHKLNKLRIGKYATDFWACSNVAGKFFFNKKIMNSDKYKVINNAIDVQKFEFNEEIRKQYRRELKVENNFVVGHVGRFHFQKNHEYLIKVFYELQKIKENAVLLLIGSGEDEQKIKNQVNELGIADKVKFLGIRKDVNSLFMAMDIMLFPSIFEGLGLVLIEAQATGLTCYTSNVVPQQTNINKNIFYLSLKDTPKVWANEIVKNKNAVKRENDASKNIAIAGYDIKEQVKSFEKLICNLGE